MKNIAQEQNVASASYDNQSKQKLKKIEAEKKQCRGCATTSYGDIGRNQKNKLKDDNSGSKQNCGSETMVYLKNRAEQESYFKQQELELRKQELALQ